VLSWWLTSSMIYGIFVLEKTLTEGIEINWQPIQAAIFLALRTPISR
jgi:hypothetical protein